MFDELRLFLQYHHQHKQIDLFELIIELVLRTDQQPAQDMAALLAVLDGRVLINLEEHDVVNAAGFIRDSMQHDYVRAQLKEVLNQQSN